MILYKNDRLLFQGDSITHGGRGENPDDLNHVIGHGYQSILAGRLLFENQAHMPQIFNRGVSGDSTSDLLRRWDRDTLSLQPTVLSLLIGVNNCHRDDGGAEKYASELRALLAQTKNALPDVRLILCEPFAFAPPAWEPIPAQAFVDRVRTCAQATRSITAEYGAVFVPFWAELERYVAVCPPGSVIWDGVHPTVFGHEIMARFWYQTVDAAGILSE